MIYLALLLSIAQIEYTDTNRKVYIIYDNSNNSQFLKSELTRNWLSKGESPITKNLDNIQKYLETKTVLINRYDTTKYKYLKCGYPCYMFGEYGTPEKFPDMTFNEVSYPLRTTNSIVSELITDINSWKAKCKRLKSEHDSAYSLKCYKWIVSHFKDEYDIEMFTLLREGYCENPNDVMNPYIVERFTYYDGYPIYREFINPPYPIIKKPWDE
jgi:hypothetical protein